MGLRQAAIEVYTQLFENPVFDGFRPGFWDKNFGLSAWGACHPLLTVPPIHAISQKQSNSK